jgi:hypothetical protein
MNEILHKRIEMQVIALAHQSIQRIQIRIESATRKWWFFLILLLMQMLPSFTTEPISPEEIGLVVGAVLSEGIVYDVSFLFPVFKLLAIFMIASVFIMKNRVSKLFSVYAGFFYCIVAVLQNVAFTEEFGFAVVTVNLLMFFLVAISWFWEAVAQKNDLSVPQLDYSRTWVIPLAILALWYPINLDTMVLDFNPILFLTSMGGLAFCLMTPMFLSVLIIFYPTINIATMRITSSVGIVISFYNILVNFIMLPESLFWNGILHIPLIVISVYAFILSIRQKTPVQVPTVLESVIV